MPIYEFLCESCDHEFETLVMRKNEIVGCPSCRSVHLEKRISAHTVSKGSPDTPCGEAPCSPRPMCGSGGCGTRLN